MVGKDVFLGISDHSEHVIPHSFAYNTSCTHPAQELNPPLLSWDDAGNILVGQICDPLDVLHSKDGCPIHPCRLLVGSASGSVCWVYTYRRTCSMHTLVHIGVGERGSSARAFPARAETTSSGVRIRGRAEPIVLEACCGRKYTTRIEGICRWLVDDGESYRFLNRS